MSDIETKVTEILSDKNHLEHLLTLEKQRRGVPVTSLAFIGMHNVAQHWWCTQYAVLKSRANEMEFFHAYLHDRIKYAHRLGLVAKLPRSREKLLDVGDEIKLADVEALLKMEDNKEAGHSKSIPAANGTLLCVDSVDKQGNRTRLINPDLPEQEREFYREMARKEGVRVIGLEDAPLWRGEILAASRAEKYPTFRWNFRWRHYTVVGEPDGITAEFVYEFKTTKNRFMLTFAKPVALTQADLYGYFFERQHKRVQIHIIEDEETESVPETYDEPVDPARAEQTLVAFARVDGGEPARPPKPWKCKGCDFRDTCPISQAK